MQSEQTGTITHNISKKRYLASMKFMSAFEEKKTKQYTTLILTFVALIVFGVFAINPTLSTIVNLRKQLEDSRLIEKQLSEKITHLQKLRGEYEALAPDLKLVEDALPESPETPKLIAQLKSLLTKHSLSIQQLKIGKVPYTKDGLAAGTTGMYALSFTISGAYVDLSGFLADAVGFNRVLSLDQVTISRDPLGGGALTGTTTIQAYYDQLSL